eukprot:1195139-Prorocentrum_minimum.AAC.2
MGGKILGDAGSRRDASEGAQGFGGAGARILAGVADIRSRRDERIRRGDRILCIRRVATNRRIGCGIYEELEPIAGAVSYREQEVGLVDGVVGHHGAVHAEHVHGHGVAHGVRAQAHEGLRHGDPRQLHQLPQLLRRVQGAAAHVEHRALRSRHRLRQTFKGAKANS